MKITTLPLLPIRFYGDEPPPDDFLTSATFEERPKEEQKPKKEEHKEDSVKILRSQRDEFKKKIEELEKRLKESSPVEELKPLSKIAEYIKNKKAKDKIEEKDVDEYIESQKQRKGKLTELEKAILEKDSKIKEISLEASDEWKENYIKPIVKARQSLFATIVDVDGESKPRKPEMVENFMKALTGVFDKDGDIDSVKLKAYVKQFEKQYREATGIEDYELRVKDVLVGLEEVNNNSKKAFEAKTNWDKIKKEENERKEFESLKEKEKKAREEEEARNFVARDVNSSYDEKSYHVDREEFSKQVLAWKEEVDKAHKEGRAVMSLKDGWIHITKGKLYDDLLQKFNELKKKYKEDEGLPGDSSISKDKDGKIVGSDKNVAPDAFLNR